ncbi:hypothetical protein EMPS_01588 [Entomortierella parvispora]|uniref:Uncharacterized protein n=1 Tax=Entomortierella parvispora TaxID=205924 RepID=A0A9P3H3U9_9FUNG|nr:hypothetical protein EMPS_01588 [Entomortierella parvispora]
MEREEVVDLGSLAWRPWIVIDAYHGLAPRFLKDKIKTLFCTTQETRAPWWTGLRPNRDLESTLQKDCGLGKSIGVTDVSKSARPGEPGTRAGGHGGSNSNFGNFNRDRFDATRMKRLHKAGDKDVLDEYQGKRVLKVMERTGGVRYFLEKDLGN